MTVITGNVAISAEPIPSLTKTSKGEIDAIRADAHEKRFLRSHEVSQENDDGVKDTNDNEKEERLSRKALNDLLDGDTTHKFAKWNGKKYSADKIYTKLDVSTHSDRLWIYNKYLEYLDQ
ncbi:hypothetical protein F442_18272 [Phytophthora nicotianae P10297]|uniref:RxLR effector protein n=1 Tax=Phytophthora nicotianae P10297 TaxID=1317064 RepID=W2YDT8_PHYNI|nr:hypothetical protein F442_18272 [Phytophthora nicotianae P10297]